MVWASDHCLDHFDDRKPCHGQEGHCIYNPDGTPGGFVAETAQVSWTRYWFQKNQDFYLDPSAAVCDSAVVKDAHVEAGARIFEHARVLKGANVEEDARVFGHALVFGGGVVFEFETLRGFDVRVGGHAPIQLEMRRVQKRNQEAASLLLECAEKPESSEKNLEFCKSVRRVMQALNSHDTIVELNRVLNDHSETGTSRVYLCDYCLVCHEDFSTETSEQNQPTPLVQMIHCGHYFHEKCVQRWFRKSQFCPLCKEEVEGSDIR